jgi:pantothenate kinase
VRPEIFRAFTRTEWAELRAHTPLTVSESDLAALQSIDEHLQGVRVLRARRRRSTVS